MLTKSWDGVSVKEGALDPHAQPMAFLPLDRFFVCPECNSQAVLARAPKTVEEFHGQYKVWVPRQQDRWCLHCGHKWTAVLAPEIIAR